MKYGNDQDLFKLIREKLYTAVCSDVLDELNYRAQAMNHTIRPVREDMIVVGRAKTILAVDVYEISKNPYEIEIKAIDSVKKGEVVVGCTNESLRNSLWGELMSTATCARGGTGAVIDGFIRDARQIKAMNFPIFCTGYKPVDSRGRGIVIDYDCPVSCGEVIVNPNDLIFGDIDGVVVVPKKIVDDVISLALEKVNKENLTRNDLLQGKLLAEVYKKYGVL